MERLGTACRDLADRRAQATVRRHKQAALPIHDRDRRPSALEDRAKEAGLNVDLFRACIAAGKATAAIRQSAALADSLGATGTPWFFLGMRDLTTNQVRVVKPLGGAQPYEQFVAAIDAALKQAEQK